jgi:hypothetical protein
MPIFRLPVQIFYYGFKIDAVENQQIVILKGAY